MNTVPYHEPAQEPDPTALGAAVTIPAEVLLDELFTLMEQRDQAVLQLVQSSETHKEKKLAVDHLNEAIFAKLSEARSQTYPLPLFDEGV